jgi:hypothetical protein
MAKKYLRCATTVLLRETQMGAAVIYTTQPLEWLKLSGWTILSTGEDVK